ncbi:MAG: lysylphosphatidylglycerol synthase transmembrane domain-containing protein [Candidatus Lernaella stagnicola]|nr:lysylphosphatidylglycerol synthase transmembrane domain-containing protein [Candidatus Lernaella stagnicola]
MGAGLLALLVVRIGPADMLRAWRVAPKGPLALAAAVFAAMISLRAVKWYVFLRGAARPASYLACLRAYSLNAFFANLTPARTGEMLAPVWLAKHDVPVATGFAVLIVDRVIDMLVVLAFFSLAAWNLARLAPAESEVYRTAGAFAGSFVGVGLAVLIVALWRLDVTMALVGRLPGRWPARLHKGLAAFRDALIPFGNRNTLAANSLLTVAGWLLDMTASFILVRTFLPGLGFLESATASMFACLASILSFVPGGIGIGAAGYTVILALLGYDVTLVGSAAVLWTVIAHGVRATMAGVMSRVA